MLQVFTINKKLPASLKTVNPFIRQAIRKLPAVKISKNEILTIALALEEALTNAMRHGNKLDPKLSVRVAIKVTPKKIMLDVHDQGPGFDFLKVPNPTKKCHRSRLSGRGIFIMRRIMDSVKFYDQGRGIKLVKFIKPTYEK